MSDNVKNELGWTVQDGSGEYDHLPTPVEGSAFTGKVTSVSDGDSFRMQLDDGKTVPVRMNYVDAPELAQPYGKESKDFLQKLIQGKVITVLMNGIDKYGRVTGIVFDDHGNNVNAEEVSQGKAWTFPEFVPAGLANYFFTLETQAQRQHRGLWSQTKEQNIPPALFRAFNRRPTK